MYCTNCGTKLSDTARFCSECGAPTGVVARDTAPLADTEVVEREVADTPREDMKDAMVSADTEDATLAGGDMDNASFADTYESDRADTEDNHASRPRTMGYSGAADNRANDYAAYAERRASGEAYAPPVYDNPYLHERSAGIAVLSFILPLVGLILWLVWKNSRPGKAISASKGALVSVSVGSPIIGLILWIALKESNAELAKPCGIGAIVGAILGFILPFVFLFGIIMFSVFFEMGGYDMSALLYSLL